MHDNTNINTFIPLYEYDEKVDKFINTLIDHIDEWKNVYIDECENCSIFGDKNLIIGFGIKDLVVVDAGDVILVMDKNFKLHTIVQTSLNTKAKKESFNEIFETISNKNENILVGYTKENRDKIRNMKKKK